MKRPSIAVATTASMSQGNGFAHVDVVLIPAGSIRGTVQLADAETAAGAGVRVDLFASNNLSVPVNTTFTNESEYEFDVVPIGAYKVDATASNGNRGRSDAHVVASGDEVPVDVVYLGRGSVFGVVVDGGGQPASNAVLTFSNSSLLGSSTITRNSAPDGSFRFDGVFVGTFVLTGAR